MHYFSSILAITSLGVSPFFIQSVLGDNSDHYETLQALPSWGYDGSWAKQSSESDVARLEPSSSEMFLWGGQRSGSRFPYANMTMFTDSQERILSMENFIPMLDSVECSEGSMTLTFKSKANFQHAIKSWQWVNDDETHSFILMANHPSCGKEERQPYYISDVDYEEDKNIAHLYGDEKTLQEVAHTFDLDFGTAPVPDQAARKIEPRWSEGFDIDMEWDYSGPVVSDEDSDGSERLELAIDCISCGTTGTISAEGHVSWSGFSPDEVKIEFSPSELGGYAEVNIDINATSTLVAYWITNIVESPAWGLNIPLVGKIGLTAALQFGVSFGSVTGSGTIQTGGGFNLPQSASCEVVLYEDPSANATGDWTLEGYSKGFNVSGEFGMSGAVFLQIAPSIGVEIFDWGLGAGPTFKPINFGLEISAVSECPETGDPGVLVGRNIGAALGAFVGTPPEGGLAVEGPTPGELQARSLMERQGIALYWTFWKGVWQEWEFCSSDDAELQSAFPRPGSKSSSNPHAKIDAGSSFH